MAALLAPWSKAAAGPAIRSAWVRARCRTHHAIAQANSHACDTIARTLRGRNYCKETFAEPEFVVTLREQNSYQYFAQKVTPNGPVPRHRSHRPNH